MSTTNRSSGNRLERPPRHTNTFRALNLSYIIGSLIEKVQQVNYILAYIYIYRAIKRLECSCAAMKLPCEQGREKPHQPPQLLWDRLCSVHLSQLSEGLIPKQIVGGLVWIAFCQEGPFAALAQFAMWRTRPLKICENHGNALQKRFTSKHPSAHRQMIWCPMAIL